MIRRLTSLLALALVFLVTGCNPGDPSEEQSRSFLKFYGSYMYDIGKDVTVCEDGGYAISGIATSADSIQHMALILTNRFGNASSPLLFYGGDMGSAGNALAKTTDGFILAGSDNDTTAAGNLRKNAFIVRTDTEGNEIWSKTYGNGSAGELNDIIVLADGSMVAAGYKNTGNHKDYWIFRIDSEGNMLDERTAGILASSDNEAVTVVETEEGYLIAATYDDIAFGGTDIVVIYTDDKFLPLNSMAFGTGFDDVATDLTAGNDAFYVLGYSEGANIVTRLYKIGIDGVNLTGGDEVATFSVSGADITGEKVVLTESGALDVAGTSLSIENKNIFLSIFNEGSGTGPLIYFGDTGNQSASGMAATDDGGVVITGGNQYEANTMITLLKLDSNGDL